MSRSSSNDDINIAYLEKLVGAVTDAAMSMQKISESYGADGQLEQTLRDLSRSVNSGDMSLKQLLKEAANTQKNIRSVEYGIEDTAKYNKTVNMFIKLLEKEIGNSRLDETLIKKITTAFENLDVTAILESEKIGQRGGKGAPLKNVMDNEKLGKVNEDLARRVGVRLDSLQYKLMTFFEGAQQRTEKTITGLGKDLLEGLEKSKWVGGALRDTVRLIGLLGANWLTQFGQLGRILGGAFYVAMETAGPLLVHLFLDGLSRILPAIIRGAIGLIGGLGRGIGRGVGNLAYAGTGPAAAFLTATSRAERVAALGAMAGPALGGGAAIGLGGAAIGQGVDSWREGRRGNAVALGLGGGAMAAGGIGLIASIFTGAIAPIVAPLLIIGTLLAGLAFLWKKFVAKEEKHQDKTSDYYSQILTELRGGATGDNILPTPQYSSSGSGSRTVKDYTQSMLLRGKTANNHLDPSKMSHEDWALADSVKPIYGKHGEILNLGQMTQRRASEVIAQDIAQKKDNSYYELLPAEYTKTEDFVTDAYDTLSGGAYAVRGTRLSFKKEREEWARKGYDVSNYKITGAIATLGTEGRAMSPHTYTSGPLSHFGTLAVTDTSGLRDKNGNIVSPKEMYQALKSMGYDASQILWEGDHYHRAMGRFNMSQEAKAKQYSIDIHEIAKEFEPDLIKQAKDHAINRNTSEDYELGQLLREKGYYKEDDLQKGYWMRKKDGALEQLWEDPSGNYGWKEVVTSIEGIARGAADR